MVNYIIFKQTVSKLYTDFLPNANGCHIDLTPVGVANNWDCVNDPVAIPDEDTTYVHASEIDLTYDLYALLDHTTETGTINYIEIFARAKTADYAVTGTYKILVDDGTCTEIKKSSNKVLTTSYVNYSSKLTINPMTNLEWTWNDFDGLQIGIEYSSPTDYVPTDNTFRPNADIDINLSSVVCDPPTQYQCINWVTPPDDYTNTVKNLSFNPSVLQADTYSLPNHNPATQQGVITNVRFCWRIVEWQEGAYYSSGTVSLIDTVNANSNDTILNFTSNWVTTCTDYATNPATAAAWTWAEIDGLQLKIAMLSVSNGSLHAIPYCNNLYIIVSYQHPENPDIRTTQCYAKVNYSIHYTMIAPENVSTDHAQNVKEMNMWNGKRIVFGESRNKWSLLLKGQDWENDACDRILAIKQLGLDGLPIAISGLNNFNWDTEWMIKSIGWKLVLEKPLHYEWIILLEKT